LYSNLTAPLFEETYLKSFEERDMTFNEARLVRHMVVEELEERHGALQNLRAALLPVQ